MNDPVPKSCGCSGDSTSTNEVNHEHATIHDYNKEPVHAYVDDYVKPEVKKTGCFLDTPKEKECDLPSTPERSTIQSTGCKGSKICSSFLNAISVTKMTLLGRVGDVLAKLKGEGYLWSNGDGTVEVKPYIFLKPWKLWNEKVNGVIQSPKDFTFLPVANSDSEFLSAVGGDENQIIRWNAEKGCYEFLNEQEFIDGVLSQVDGSTTTDVDNGCCNSCNNGNVVYGVDGKDGEDGKDGKSAYELWIDNGNVGSVDIFLQSLKGTCASTCQSCGDEDEPDDQTASEVPYSNNGNSTVEEALNDLYSKIGTSSGGDDWGAQTVTTDDTLTGDGTASSPLSVASQEANAITRYEGGNGYEFTNFTTDANSGILPDGLYEFYGDGTDTANIGLYQIVDVGEALPEIRKLSYTVI